jgi:hypothetical protein
MTLAEAEPLVRLKIAERTNDAGLVTPDECKTFIKEANRFVWKKAVRANPEPWLTRGAGVVFPASAGELALHTLTGSASVDLVSEIDFLEAQGTDTRWYALWPVPAGQQDRFLNEPFVATPAGLHAGFSFEWYIEGQAIRLTPPPSTDLTLRPVWLARIPDPVDGGQLLNGRFWDHHDAVVTKAACLCYHRDGMGKTPWDGEYDALEEELILAAKRGLQGMRSRRTAPRDPFNAA